MVTPQEKAQCVSWFIKTQSDVQTRRRYRTKYGKDSPPRSSIRRWHKKFMETGSVLVALRSGQPRTSAENIGSERQAFSPSPVKGICSAARELELPLTTVQQCTRFCTKGYDYMLTKCKCYRDFSQMTS